MRGKLGIYASVVITTLSVLLLTTSVQTVSATAGVNQELSFEGKIVNSSGQNIADGTYNMEFKIYTAAGTCNPTTGVGCTLGWTEDWLVSAGNGVALTSGTYQVNLDQVAANNFSGIDFNSYPLYLSLQIGSTASCTPAGNFQTNCGGDGEMKPYILLTAAPYALNSNALGGMSASAFGQVSANNTWTGTNLLRTASTTAFQVQNSSNNSVLTVDTSANQVLLGKAGASGLTGNLVFYNSAGANTVSLSAQSVNPASSLSLFLPVAGATGTQCLQSTSGSTSTSTTLQFGSCSGGSSTLASTYSGGTNQASSTMTLDSTRLGIIIKDAATPITGSLFTVQDNAGTTKFLDVSSGAFNIQAGTTLSLLSASGSVLTVSAQGAGQSNFGTSGAGLTVLGNSTGNTQLQGPTYTTTDSGVFIGSGGTTANPILLGLSNATFQGAETASTCTTSVNSGAIYYSAATLSGATSGNATTNEVRGCIDGSWTDIVTGDQLGLLLFGVESSSGPTTGDITGLSGYTNSPCKVSWFNTTTISVAPCTAYSGGRKVVVSSSVTFGGLGSAGSVTFQNVCLNGTNGAPALTTPSTTETASVPAWNAAAPILCLATIKLSTTQTITNIYDTRVFTTSVKEYAAASTPVAPGMVVLIDSTGDNMVKTTSTANSSPVRGVVAVGNSAGSTTNVNSIIIVGGPAFVKMTGTVTVGNSVQTSTTAGYGSSQATSTKWGTYHDLGLIVGNGNATACNATTNCQYSAFTEVVPF